MSRRRSLVLLFALSVIGSLPLAAQRSDDEIYNDVKRRLANDPDVKGGAFDVDVKAGVVTVKGKVERDNIKAKAERLVKKVKGVKSVVNQITVQPRSS